MSMLLPRALDTKIYMRLSVQTKAVLLSLTTAAQDELANAAGMGSFVYALPDVSSNPFCAGNRLTQRLKKYNDTQPLATALFPHEPTLEFTTRMAKLLARRLQRPVYVTNSISFANAGMGGTVEEEMEAFRAIVQVTLQKLQEAGVGPAASVAASSAAPTPPAPAVNGIPLR